METTALPRFRSLIFKSLCIYGLSLVGTTAALMFATNKLTEDMTLDRLMRASVEQQTLGAPSLFAGRLEDMPEQYRSSLEPLAAGATELDEAGFEVRVIKEGSGASARYALLRIPGDDGFTPMLGLVAVGVLVALLLSLGIGYRLTNRFCTPVEDIAAGLDSPDKEFDQPLVAELAYLHEHIDRFRTDQQVRLEHERAFVGAVSHELRTPITVIQGAVELLQQEDIAALRPDRVNRIARASDSLSLTTQSLLALTRAELQLSASATNFYQAVENVVEQGRSAARPGVSIECNVSQHPSSQFEWALLVVAIQTLLDNAITHTKGGEITIDISADQLVIIDTGPGIAPEKILQLKNNTPQAGQLGYAIVHRICQRCGWRLELESNNQNANQPTIQPINPPTNRGTRVIIHLTGSHA